MKKISDNLILIILLICFVFLFRYNDIVKIAILDASRLWFYNLVPFMLPMYFITDLLLNYGLGNLLYKIFKNNYIFLIIVSMFLGSPSNAKYISEFYKEGYIDLNCAHWLMLFAYSPNPLFILGISPTLKIGLIILIYIYLSNFLLAVFSKNFFKVKSLSTKCFQKCSFSKCLESSILKSFNVLILILGIISFYGILNSFIDLFFPNGCILIKILLEMTTSLNAIISNGQNILLFMLLSVSFSGLSIHTQIKSILEDTSISYKYFILGRVLASFPLLFLLIIY